MEKDKREEIWNKYNKCCAYCGKSLAYSEMQVDHIHPIAKGGKDQKSNFNPSCFRCNHYKRASSLEQFRVKLRYLNSSLQELYKFKIARDYSMVMFKPWDGVFYFEKFNS